MANKYLLTPQFPELRRYEIMSANQKIYFGPNIPFTSVNELSPPVRGGFWYINSVIIAIFELLRVHPHVP